MPSSQLEFFIDEASFTGEAMLKSRMDRLRLRRLAKGKRVTTRNAVYGRAMNASMAMNANTLAHDGFDSEVASVGVMDGDKLLMGKRKDNGKWTLPGGHLERGEKPHAGALRELYEESGVVAQQLDPLGSQGVIGRDGSTIMVHAYMLTASPEVTTKLDPDGEFSELRWVDTTHGLPKEIEDNLHSPQNVVLHRLGIQKSFVIDELSSPNIREKPYHPAPGEPGYSQYFIETLKETLGQKSIGDEPGFTVSEPSYFVADLVKGRPHKYLRKYKSPTGKWIYIYHEGQQRGRAVPEEAVNHIRALAEQHGDPHARELMGTMQEHAPEKMKILRTLATKHNDTEAQAHLEHMGVDWRGEHEEHKAKKKETKRQSREAEEGILSGQRAADAAREANPLTRTRTGEDLTKLHRAIQTAVSDKIFGHLRQHETSAAATNLRANGITLETTMAPVLQQTSVHGALKALHESLKKVDQAHVGISSANTEANRQGGYGNHAYNGAVQSLISEGALPPEARDAHVRTISHHNAPLEIDAQLAAHAQAAETRRRQEEATRGERERQQREQRERQQREQAAREAEEAAALTRELGPDSLAMHINQLAGGRLDTHTIKEIHKVTKAMFGRPMKKEDWPYDFAAQGLTVKVRSVRTGGGELNFNFSVKDAQGESVTDSWERKWWAESPGHARIYNSYLAVNPSARGGAKLGSLINTAQAKMMKALAPEHGEISVSAALDVGGYNWTNQGFSFTNASSLHSKRDEFKMFARQHGITLSDADLQHFTKPCHFSAFNDGKTYVKDNLHDRMPISAKMREHGTLTGKPETDPKFRLSQSELDTGKTGRMAVHLGKLFMLGRSWSGTMKAKDMKDTNEAWRLFQSYSDLKDKSWKTLSDGYRDIVARTQGKTGADVPRPVPGAGGASAAPAATPNVIQMGDRQRRSEIRLPRGIDSQPLGRLMDLLGTSVHQMTRAQSTRVRSAMGKARAKLADEIRTNGSGYYQAAHGSYRIHKDGDKWHVTRSRDNSPIGREGYTSPEQAIRQIEQIHATQVSRPA